MKILKNSILVVYIVWNFLYKLGSTNAGSLFSPIVSGDFQRRLEITFSFIAGPQITSFCSTSFFYNFDEKP